eukprot:2174286-Pyramimonas_sp.AAC.1
MGDGHVECIGCACTPAQTILSGWHDLHSSPMMRTRVSVKPQPGKSIINGNERSDDNITLLYGGSSYANNGKDAHNTPEEKF